MNQTAKALYDFWSSFGLPAFAENAVPDDLKAEQEVTREVEETIDPSEVEETIDPSEAVVQPYITYQVAKPYWRQRMMTYARVYYFDTSYADITAKVSEIESRIGECLQLSTDSGFLLLYPDTNFCQFVPQPDVRQKVAYISLVIEAYTE